MIRKGNKVKWKENNAICVGIVEDTYWYKGSRKRKKNKVSRINRAAKALYIRLKNGKHVLKNDNEVILEKSSGDLCN